MTLGAHSVGLPPAWFWLPTIGLGSPSFTHSFTKIVQFTAGADVGGQVGIGAPDVANVHVSVDNSLDFAAQPDDCSWNLDLGKFSAGGQLLGLSINSPSTPPLYHKTWDVSCGTNGGHPVGSDKVTVANPGNQSGSLGSPVDLQIQASDTAAKSLSYSATGLPAGLSISRSTGLITGTPTTPGRFLVTVKVTDTTGVSATTAFNWTLTTRTGTGGGPTFTQITAGGEFACGLESSGTGVCWGDNTYGESSQPDDAFTQISAGGDFACGLESGGTAVCWGHDIDGTTSPPDDSFTQITAGDYFACGLESGGTAICWGYDFDRETSPPDDSFTQITAGENFGDSASFGGDFGVGAVGSLT